MAFSGILRRTASLTIRYAIGTQRSYSSSIITPLKSSITQSLYRTSFLSTLNFSSLAKVSKVETNLVNVIDSEIKCAEDDQQQVDMIPGFPFKIHDEPGKQTISLQREYQGEVITVEVHIPELEVDEEEEAGEGEGEAERTDGNNESGGKPSISLIVNVSKDSNEQSLEFGCTVYPDEIIIDSLIVKDPNTSEDDLAYEGPDFTDLDESLQEAFYKYLEVRGIKASTTNFLYDYMVSKDDKEYLRWLKNVKNFIQN